MRDATPRLGRGLAALLGDPGRAANSDASLVDKPVTVLEASPFQPRGPIQEVDLAELSASIRAQGVLQPLLIRPHPHENGRFQIIAGERRWRAAMLAGLPDVPCFVRSMSDADATAAALVENLQREDLNPVEEAEGYRRLVDEYGLTQEQLGIAIGKSRSHVANLLRLLNLPPAVLEHVRTGALSAGHARAALACANPSDAAALMIARSLNVRQAEALATAPAKSERTKKPRNQFLGTADLHAVERDLADQLGLQVSITFDGRGGSITLRYQTLDQLDHVIGKLGRP